MLACFGFEKYLQVLKSLTYSDHSSCDRSRQLSILKTAGKKLLFRIVLRSLYLASLTSGYLCYLSFTAYAANDNSEKENTVRGLFEFIPVELRDLLISEPPSRLRKWRSCKVEILICA